MNFKRAYRYGLCALLLSTTLPAQALIVELLQELAALSEFNRQNRQIIYDTFAGFSNDYEINKDFFSTKTITTEHEQAFTFADLAGEIPKDVLEVIEFIKNPERFARVGAEMPHGILLYGPPGTGKTSIARAIAGEAEAEFFNASGSEFVEVYIGVGPQRVRELFDKARRCEKALIFIDEIDAIGSKRSGDGNSEYRNTLNELLNQMDGFAKNHNVTIIAATNMVHHLDSALLRPGRFDRLVKIDLPDEQSRADILTLYCSKIAYLGTKTVFTDIARKTAQFSGAELKKLANEAAVLAARENADSVTEKHLYESLSKVLKQKHLA